MARVQRGRRVQPRGFGDTRRRYAAMPGLGGVCMGGNGSTGAGGSPGPGEPGSGAGGSGSPGAGLPGGCEGVWFISTAP
jgi:hypothetical protein